MEICYCPFVSCLHYTCLGVGERWRVDLCSVCVWDLETCEHEPRQSVCDLLKFLYVILSFYDVFFIL